MYTNLSGMHSYHCNISWAFHENLYNAHSLKLYSIIREYIWGADGHPTNELIFGTPIYYLYAIKNVLLNKTHHKNVLLKTGYKYIM